MNRKLSLICIIVMAMLLSACASTPNQISSIPAFSPPPITAATGTPASIATPAPLPIQISNPTIVRDLQAMASNIDQAVAIGALPKDDPAAPCIHDFLQRAGVENAPGATPPQSFKPDNAGVFSAGAIIYILAQQSKATARAGGIQISQQCLALVGQIHLDAITATAKGAARLLPVSIPGIGLR